MKTNKMTTWEEERGSSRNTNEATTTPIITMCVSCPPPKGGIYMAIGGGGLRSMLKGGTHNSVGLVVSGFGAATLTVGCAGWYWYGFGSNGEVEGVTAMGAAQGGRILGVVRAP
eukprot:7549422-Pyramimonas_sp.AAC.1